MYNNDLTVICNGWPSYQVHIELKLKLNVEINACFVFKLDAKQNLMLLNIWYLFL